MSMRAPIPTLLSLALLAACAEDPPPPAPTVALAAPVRGAVESAREGFTQPITAPSRVEEDATLTTAADGRATLRLDGGAFALLDRGTRVEVGVDRITLEEGRLWVEARGTATTTVASGAGEVRTEDGSFAAEVRDGRLEIYCGAGELTYAGGGDEGRVGQGETLAMDGDGAEVDAADVWDDWTGGLVDPAPRDLGDAHSIGVLRGRRPTALGEAPSPLSMRAQEVNVAVRGDLAVTEVVQTFFNGQSEPLEAEYAVRVPGSAIVADFQVDTGAGFQPSVVEALGAAGAYQLDWRSHEEPGSRLVYDGPGRLRARVFPVPPGAVVRVKLRYTEWLERRGAIRTYVYPMCAGDDPPLIGEFALRVDTSGTTVGAFRAGMGAEVHGPVVSLRRGDFRPRADFYLDLVDPADLELPEGVAAYHASPDAPSREGGQEAFALFDVPTGGLFDPARAGAEPLDLVLLVDASGGTDTEDLELARGVVESILEQLAPTDRVTLRLGDVTARLAEGVPPEPEAASAEVRDVILESLARARRGGASDLAATLREAATVVAGKPRGAVIYLGDGLPTTGALDATGIRRALAAVDPPPRIFALGVGDGANLDLLRALFGADAAPVRARSGAARVVMELLAEAARPTLQGLTFDLGPGVERVFPAPPLTVRAGAPLRLLARVREVLPKTIEVRGHRGGEPFAETLTVRPTQVTDEGDIRRRWAEARLASLLDANAGREAILDLGLRFGLVTPFTARVVGGAPGGWYMPIRGFDHDPYQIAWSLGGRGAVMEAEALGAPAGWRARFPAPSEDAAVAVESTWRPRILDAAPSARARGAATSDGGLARAGVLRALRLGGRGPEGCYERRLLVRPDLEGEVAITLDVDALGQVRALSLLASTVADADLEACVLAEVRGIQFPVTGGSGVVSVTHRFAFRVPGRELGVRRACSEAARFGLETRKRLWAERLEARPGAAGALETYREAQRFCELDDWRARRTLMEAMLRARPALEDQLAIYDALESDPVMEVYLRRAILRRARDGSEVLFIRQRMGLEAEVEWPLVSALFHAEPDPEARLRLIRRWLAVVPEDLDLRLHKLSLLEETRRFGEARRLAHELRDDPLADATVRARVGEFWLRQEKPEEARRVFSEIVEGAPLDPWARRRLGDLYLAHGWADDAYREYQALAALRPDAKDVLLLLARAAAGAGRLDEALRLEQRLGEEEGELAEGPAAIARLYTAARLARLRAATTDPAELAAIAARERGTGAFRRPPDLLVALTWAHPEDRLALRVRYPGAEGPDAFEDAPLDGGPYGIAGLELAQRDPGALTLRVIRGEAHDLRPSRATLTVVLAPGTDHPKVLERELVLDRDARVFDLTLEGEALGAPAPGPAPR
jgi:tetratricopeptide (TPR) repeat protein